MGRGIYLIANHKSQALCANLIFSIRKSGCRLPIRLIHFGGKPIDIPYIKNEVELIAADDFGIEANRFVANLASVMPGCPKGILYRFLCWYGDWSEFIYSDNDVVALNNWEEFFPYLGTYELVHADEEYTTEGKFNYRYPDQMKHLFGKDCLLSAVTAGHFAVRKQPSHIGDFQHALSWFRNNPDIPYLHDQALLHVALLLGNWQVLNLCKKPYNWLSPWAGDYQNTLQLIQRIQAGPGNLRCSHIHFSGWRPNGHLPLEELLFSNLNPNLRAQRMLKAIGIAGSGLLWFEKKRRSVGLRIKKVLSTALSILS